MATKGTPTAGLNEFLRRMLKTDTMSLICYTNTAGSLSSSSVYADLAQPTQTNGYAPITLATSSWSISNGAATYGGNTQWSATGAWSATVIGYAIISSDSILLQFKDLDTPFIATSGGKLAPNLQDLVVPT